MQKLSFFMGILGELLSNCLLTIIQLVKMQQNTMTICVTGAAGQIAYSFIPQLASGMCFPGVKLHLRLLDIQPALNILRGVALELEDCSYPLVRSVLYGCKPEEMFEGADVIVFLGGYPRKPGMERKDLLKTNKNIFEEQGKALIKAKPDVKCLVIANPANTNAYILSHYAPHIKKQSITCLTRLDHNRAVGQIMTKTGAELSDIEGVYIFGNHSLTQYPCINNIKVKEQPLEDREWLEKTYVPRVQKRGGEILQIRGGSSVFSAAKAVVDHLRDWCNGSERVVSMGVVSEGDYGIPEGIWSSFPVTCKDFKYEIIKGYPLSKFCQEKIAETVKQLQEEIQGAEVDAVLTSSTEITQTK